MKKFALCAALALIAAPSFAAEPSAMKAYIDANVRSWIEAPEVVSAIVAQNAANASLTQADIDALDAKWRTEVGTSDTPTITPVVSNALSDFLRNKVAEAGGTIAEVFVMDNHGMLVASSGVTSDYWQGDEDKWQQTYGVGPDAMNESEIEFDESTQTYVGQVSFTIVDPATGAPIGAVTFGLDAESLM